MLEYAYPGVYPEISPEDAARLAERKVLLIDRHVAQQVIEPEEVLEVLEQAYREEGLGTAVNRTKANILIPTPSPERWYRYCTMEGGVRGLGVVAIRIKSDMAHRYTAFGRVRQDWHCTFPGRFMGLILLFSAEDGSLLAFLHDAHIQHMRVAATVTLATRQMAREDSHELAIIGSGGMAWSHALFLPQVRPIRRVRVYSPNPAHRESFARQLGKATNMEVTAVDSAEAAVRGADIVAACTNAREPVIRGADFKKGAHIILTLPSGVDYDEDALAVVERAVRYESPIGAQGTPSETRWTAEPDWNFAGGTTREQLDRRNRLIGADNIFTLPDILLGRVEARQNDDQITASWNEGTGVQFAAVSSRVYRNARARGLGQELPLEWFLQDVTN